MFLTLSLEIFECRSRNLSSNERHIKTEKKNENRTPSMICSTRNMMRLLPCLALPSRYGIRILSKKNDNFAPVTCGVNLHESKWHMVVCGVFHGPMFFRPCLLCFCWTNEINKTKKKWRRNCIYHYHISKGAHRHLAFWFSKHIFWNKLKTTRKTSSGIPINFVCLINLI